MKSKLLLGLLFAAATQVSFAQVAFKDGTLSVLRIGDGTTALGTDAAPVFIDEYSTAGVLQRSIALPTALPQIGNNKRLTLDGNTANVSSFEGLLALSQDGKKLTLTGYDAAVGTAAIASSASATHNRVIGIIDGAGNVNTSTALNIYSGSLISSAVVDGDDLWVSGGAANIYYTTVGATSATAIAGRTGRSMRIFNDQLYASQSGSSSFPVISIGSGLPKTAGQTVAGLPGMTSGTAYAREFFFADIDPDIPGNDVLYIVNPSNTEGIAKYSLVDGEWVLNSRITGTYIGLTGVVSGSTVTLYGVRFSASTNSLFKITDNTGYNGEMSTIATPLTNLATAGANTVFRGISLSPKETTQPVSLSSFTAKSINQGAQLNWITTSEQNNSHFEIYRSTDRQNFTFLGDVKGNGTSDRVLNYLFIDQLIPAGTSYYKLRQVDIDGKYKEYGPVVIHSDLQKADDITLSVKENSIELGITASGPKAEIIIRNVSGQKIISTSANLNKGINQVNIPFQQNPGLYILSVKQENEVLTKKFIK